MKDYEIIDTLVLKVTAVDAGEGLNSQYRYQIQDESEAFQITQDVSKYLERFFGGDLELMAHTLGDVQAWNNPVGRQEGTTTLPIL